MATRAITVQISNNGYWRLPTTQGADLPLFMRPLDGNSSDRVSLMAAIAELHKQLRAPDEEQSIYVADSGVYSQANMQRLNAAQIQWVSRVPDTSVAAREELVAALGMQADWQESAEGEMRWCSRRVELPHGQERWAIVSSTASEQRVRATLQRQVSREQQSWEKRLWHLGARRFACEADAQAALTHSLKDLPAWFEVQATCVPHDHYEGKGRPAKETAPIQRWQCQTTLTLNAERLAEEGRRRACFIVGTNILDPAQLSDEELISTRHPTGQR